MSFRSPKPRTHENLTAEYVGLNDSNRVLGTSYYGYDKDPSQNSRGIYLGSCSTSRQEYRHFYVRRPKTTYIEHLLSRLAAIVIVETLTKAATIEIEARLKRNCSASSRCETALSTSNMGGNAYATEVPLHFIFGVQVPISRVISSVGFWFQLLCLQPSLGTSCSQQSLAGRPIPGFPGCALARFWRISSSDQSRHHVVIAAGLGGGSRVAETRAALLCTARSRLVFVAWEVYHNSTWRCGGTYCYE